ncbi:xylulokinase [Hasllibacter sp. MH4015]|uniref:xylulokinase n=1 Tax=Hasllibacter sp. MH4015 TaxID=2854029 RepID=UPI001CD7D01A|nr:xylulokinase [Hasllibacter sp. MH4015]
MTFLGIDIGTSAVKLCAMADDGTVRAVSDAPLSTTQPFPGASEQDPEAWIDALTVAMQGLPGAIRRDVSAIGLSGQMHGAVLLDADTRVIRPAILWNDGRASAECDVMESRLPEMGHVAGVPPMPGFTAPKLMWLKSHEPDTYSRIATVLLPKDYVGFRLHGAHVTDPSDAAGTCWFDQHARAWSPDLCATSDTDPNWMPEVRDGSAIAGRLDADMAEALGLSAGIPVAAGAGDAAAGAVGIGAVDPGDGFLSLGTSGQLFVTTDACRPNPASRIHAYAHTLPGRWFQMAAMLNGARPMAWLAELLGRPIPDLLAEAEGAEPGPIFLPYLTGERTPHGDADIRAGFWGLSEGTTQGTMMRAVVEAVAFTFADALAAMEAAGTRPARLLAIGGGTRSDFLLQMIADVMGVPIGRSDGADIGPALGAARLAQIATGAPVADVAVKPDVSRWFEPDATRAGALAPRLAGYRALYPALKSVSAAMI